jgi:hypothetical protein
MAEAYQLILQQGIEEVRRQAANRHERMVVPGGVARLRTLAC